jgi:hypothetical protein
MYLHKQYVSVQILPPVASQKFFINISVLCKEICLIIKPEYVLGGGEGVIITTEVGKLNCVTVTNSNGVISTPATMC